MSQIDSNQLLGNAREMLKAEGFDLQDNARQEDLLELLRNNKDVFAKLSAWEAPYSVNPIRKIKNIGLKLLKNMAINIFRPAILQQQKFNEVAVKVLEDLDKRLPKNS